MPDFFGAFVQPDAAQKENVSLLISSVQTKPMATSTPTAGATSCSKTRSQIRCAFRKSHPDILMVQPAKDRVGDDGSDVLDSPQKRRVLL